MFWAGVESKTLSRHVVHLWTRLGTARIACVQNALLRSGSHVFRWNTRSWVAGSEFSPDPQNDPTRLTSSLSIFIMNHHESIQFSNIFHCFRQKSKLFAIFLGGCLGSQTIGEELPGHVRVAACPLLGRAV